MQRTSNQTRIKWLMVGFFTYLLISSVGAQYFEIKDPILQQNGIEYAITGVGESKQDPRWSTFPLRLEFATVRGELYSDVDLLITDTNQKKVFHIKVNAPWLLVRLKPGTYYVYAKDTAGKSKSATVVVPASGQARHTFKW